MDIIETPRSAFSELLLHNQVFYILTSFYLNLYSLILVMQKQKYDKFIFKKKLNLLVFKEAELSKNNFNQLMYVILWRRKCKDKNFTVIIAFFFFFWVRHIRITSEPYTKSSNLNIKQYTQLFLLTVYNPCN